MPVEQYWECDYCGHGNKENEERCIKCEKIKDEDVNEFDKWKNQQDNDLHN